MVARHWSIRIVSINSSVYPSNKCEYDRKIARTRGSWSIRVREVEESRSWRGDRLPVEKESKGQKMYGHDRERIRLSNSSSLFPPSPSLLVKLASPCTRAFPVGKLCKVGQTGMTRRKVGRRISVTIDGPDLRTSAGRRNRPIDTRLLRKVWRTLPEFTVVLLSRNLEIEMLGK